MNYFCDANIGDIKIIIRKDESTDFHFHNPSRFSAGFVCFLSGHGTIVFEGEGEYPVEPGSFFRYEIGDCYTIHVNAPCAYYVSEIDIAISSPDAFPRSAVCTEGELAALEKIHRVWKEQEEYCYLETRILLLRFLMELSKRVRSAKETVHFLSDALSYIHRHYHQSFTLNEIASACKVSPSYLRNRFRERFGMSVMQYRENLRIARAKTMLEGGEYQIKEIADFLGYCDIYHFSRKFKQATGVSPTYYQTIKWE